MIKLSTPFSSPHGGVYTSTNPAVSLWAPPNDNGFIRRISTNSTLFTGKNGPELFTSTNFTAGITVVPEPGATYECWLLVLGQTIPTNTGNTLFLSGAAATGNGVGINSTTVRLRASSAYVVNTAVAPIPGEVLFVKLQTGDFRVYQRGQLYTSSSASGTTLVTQGMALAGSSLAFAARWTNTTPTDDEIWALLDNPWALLEPRTQYIPVSLSGSTNYPISADAGSYSITGQSATLSRSKVVVANHGVYSLTGQAATVAYAGSSANYTITANHGTYSIAGQAATVRRNKKITANHGVYTLAGQAATLAYSGTNTITLKAGSWLRYRIIT